ncbi:hypothetical protein BH23BAC1_BH23BAC1_39440 [soil metagenome]
MSNSIFSKPIVIVIIVRDRFSMFKQCLEAVYLHTKQQFKVIVVVGGADKTTQTYLSQFQEENENFKVIFKDNLLMQGEARNIALNHFDERYCIFLENDTIVHNDWLPPLLECMEEEKAAVVTPLIYWHRGIHSTGGKFVEYEKDGKKMFKNKILYNKITRKRIDYPENHCILIDRDQFPKKEIFEDVEPFDVDLGLILKKYGKIVFFEPRSVVTYSAPPLLKVRDVPPFIFRWDANSWEKRNLSFMIKWSLNYDPTHKMASYKRQQFKLGMARRYPNKITIVFANFLIIGLNYLLRFHHIISLKGKAHESY